MRYATERENMGCSDATQVCGMPSPEMADEPLVELMGRTKEVGFAVLRMAEEIEKNLFGDGTVREEKNPPVMCHRDALEQHHYTLCDAANALNRICSKLGVTGVNR